MITAVIAGDLDGHPEAVLDEVAAAAAAGTEAGMILAAEDHALTVEDVEGREIEVMAHAIRAETRSIRRRESQVVMAADPEIEAI